MEQHSEEYNLPTYNMKVVIQETGLKPMTIRTWERRYGLPRPLRAKGGHRLYSQYEIDILKWLIARQSDGMSISNAAELWHALAAKGEKPHLNNGLVETSPAMFHKTMRNSGQNSGQNKLYIEPGEEITQLRDHWLTACLDFDRTTADEVLTQAFARYPLEMVCTEILSKSMVMIGEGWVDGKVSIQQEHFTSELAVRRLESLIAAMPLPTRTERVLVCCAPNDNHVFSPLLLTFFLLRRGWDVLYLGANVPAEAVKQTVTQTKPNLVVISAQRLYTASTLLDVTQALSAQGTPFGYGGVIFNQLPNLRTLVPGYFLGESLHIAIQNIEHLLTQSVPTSLTRNIVSPNEHALEHYQTRRALVEAHVWNTFFTNDSSTHLLTALNLELSQTISAALRFGSMDLLGNDIVYIEHLLVNFRPTRELLEQYLLAYCQAAQIHLDKPAAIVVDWLSRIVTASRLPIAHG